MVSLTNTVSLLLPVLLLYIPPQDEDEGMAPAPTRATFSATQDLLLDASRGEQVRIRIHEGRELVWVISIEMPPGMCR